MARKSVSKNTDDPRPKAVGQIWAAAVGMLAICIPLCAVLRSAILPFFVIAGAALATLYIWSASSRNQEPPEDEAESLRAKIKELEDRLANVEVINRFEDRLAEKQVRLAQEKPEARAEASPSPDRV